MPSLKQISCCLQWSDTAAPFQEYGTAYGDGVVESFIVVPAHAQGFCIRLTSRGYISEGLAMVVFIDGNYQANRLRLNLLPPKKGRPSNRTEVDFLLRQQEKPQGDGLYMGRAWRFDNHNIVPEAPGGFQASHFDDLGTIEVLVLRCNARDRVDADYEGSSSGEDSDILEDRPAREEHEKDIATTAAISAPTLASAAVEAESEDMMGGLFGIFDGANDMYDGSAHRDRRSGQWVWHQKERPQGLPPDVPPTFHTVPDTRFRTTSNMQSNAYYQPQQMPHYPTNRSSKQVHFDFGASPPTQQPQEPQDHYSRSSRRQGYPAQQRPVSRERVRSINQPRSGSPIPRPPTPPGAPYGPQTVNPSSNSNPYSDQNSAQQQQPSAQNQNFTRQAYRDRPSEAWTSNKGNQNGQSIDQDQRGGNRTATQASQPTQYSQPAQYSRPVYNHQEANQQYNHAQSQPTSLREQYAYQSHNPLPHLNQSTYLPQYFQHQASGYPFTPPVPPPPLVPPSYASYMPPEGHVYPPQVMLPPGYAQPGSYPHPYWPHHYTGSYAYPQQQNFTGSPRIFEEEISPKNVPYDIPFVKENAQGASPAISDQNGNAQPPRSDDADWVNGGNDGAATSGATNQNDADNWNAAGENQNTNNSWTNQDNNDNSGDGAWATSTENVNDNNNNNNNNTGSWENEASNDATANSGWDNTNNNQSSEDPHDSTAGVQRSEPDLAALANAARDLYGPHGPYYSFRALRLDEPKPDAQEEPRYDVPKAMALAKGSTKQVQPGPGYRYYKRRLEPEYIDSMDNPYARFVFKYRTKEQLASEIGITVDVEPTGDHEIQDLQRHDKQTLVEMLMRAKTALGGKIPSPPPTPSTRATASDLGPVAVEAPKLPYLKYSLPPLRPSNISKKSTPSNSAAGSKTSLVGKENIAPTRNGNNGSWDNSANNSNSWGEGNDANNSPNNNPDGADWGVNNSPAQNNTSQPGSQASWTANQSRQTSKSSGSKRAPAREEAPDNDVPPRPPTPDTWDAAGNSTTVKNWDAADQGGNQTAANW